MTARAIVAAVAMALATGCARPAFLRPAPERNWESTIAAARAAAGSGQWASADRALSDFILRHPGSDEAHDAVYWRGVFRLAPANDSASRRLAIPTFEQYLASPGGSHRTEAQVLLALAREHEAVARVAAQREREIEQVRAALGRAQERAAPSDAPSPADRGLAQEVERLKAELTRANQELERIRRRLGGQRP